MGKLVLLLADGTTLDVPLTKERMTIGRRADNDICLPHPAVSGEHASVVTILADSFLEDLGSTNGTLVNGKPIVKHFLRDYDQIDIGRQRLVFVSDDNARVDGLPPDIARNQLMGLTNRVDGVHAAPKVAVPSIAGLRTRGGAGLQRLEYADLDDELEHEAAGLRPFRSAKGRQGPRSPIASRRRRAASPTSDSPRGRPSGLLRAVMPARARSTRRTNRSARVTRAPGPGQPCRRGTVGACAARALGPRAVGTQSRPRRLVHEG